MSEQCPHIVGMSWCEQCAEERIAELEQRLEIDPRHQTDGIEARDETIKGLEGVIAESNKWLRTAQQLERENEELKARIHEACEVWAGVEGRASAGSMDGQYFYRVARKMYEELLEVDDEQDVR